MTELSPPFIITVFMHAIGKWIVSDDILMCEDKDQMDALADTVIREQSCVVMHFQLSFPLRFYLLVLRQERREPFSGILKLKQMPTISHC